MKHLSSREVRLIWITTLLLGGWAGWTLLVGPLVSARNQSFQDIATANAIADLLDRAPLAGFSPIRGPAIPLGTRVTTTAETAGLKLRRLEPSGTALSVTFDDAPYTALIGWLDVLTREEGSRIVSVEIARRPPPGIVSARIMLEPRP